MLQAVLDALPVDIFFLNQNHSLELIHFYMFHGFLHAGSHLIYFTRPSTNPSQLLQDVRSRLPLRTRPTTLRVSAVLPDQSCSLCNKIKVSSPYGTDGRGRGANPRGFTSLSPRLHLHFLSSLGHRNTFADTQMRGIPGRCSLWQESPFNLTENAAWAS